MLLCFVGVSSFHSYLVNVLEHDNHRLDITNIFSKYSPYYLTCVKTPKFTQRKLMKGISKLDNILKKNGGGGLH